ncbi:hypothetical protein DTO027B5_9067 [Paecilomyces variotii]|nr:hypothetical protein DTO027B3_9030 [Paecilomyces variotii]KAJ9327089.1 hypothetical protein DTO027B5_9067 [Paecilomyces variotii]
MPPPVEDISEDESTGDAIPYDNGKESGAEESDEEEGEDVYVVEKIMGHEYKKDTLFLHVKWKGYDKPEDQTLEPEENLLDGAKEAVDEYYAKLGGRPEKPSRKRKSLNEAKATPEKATQKKPRKSRGTASAEPAASEENDDVPDWVPKSKNWEKDILKVDTIMRDPDTGSLMAYLHWNNGKKSRVSIEQCYEKCPMKMLRFYEQHLVFKEG